MTDERGNDLSLDQSLEQSAATPGTHRAANFIAKHQKEVLNLWVDAVMDTISSAKGQSRAEVGNHLQNLLDDIVRALNAIGDDLPSMRESPLEEFGRPSSLHGRERASISGYTVDQVVHEYVILRRTLTGFCADHDILDARTTDIIAYIVEYASLSAVKEFVRSIQDIQQKLVGTLVHDVRTPLSVASNYAELLSIVTVPEEQKQKAVYTIIKSLKRAGSMLEDLLDTVTMEAGHGLFMRFEEGDINDALETVCKEADHLYGERSIKANLAARPVVGVFDMALVIRTVENLISNAVKFGDKSTPVSVSLEDNGDRVTVRVHNHGKPIPKAEISEIFRFFATSEGNKNSAKGWGLGLSLIKTVVKHHGGEVILDSTSDNGTTFGMTLHKRYHERGSELSVLI